MCGFQLSLTLLLPLLLTVVVVESNTLTHLSAPPLPKNPPPNSLSVLDFGAVGDGKHVDTVQIQKVRTMKESQRKEDEEKEEKALFELFCRFKC